VISCSCGRPTLDGLCDSCTFHATACISNMSKLKSRALRELNRSGIAEPTNEQIINERRRLERRASKERARKPGLTVAKNMGCDSGRLQATHSWVQARRTFLPLLP
jgi:hypothetical protein